MADSVVEIDGHQLQISNLDKVLYPATGFTKAEIIDYYARIASTMLAHLAGRALTLVRYPDGIDREMFFEKRCPSHRPPWIKTGGEQDNCLVDNVAGLVWLANLAALELHVLQWRVDDPQHATGVVLDLDPGAPATIVDCCRVALELHTVLEQLGLEAIIKTSGSKGLHLYIPLNTGVTPDDTKALALALGQLLAKRDPKLVTVDMAKQKRSGRVFVDWSQNDRHKTTVAPYSLRATPLPLVSTPVTWDEVDETASSGDAHRLSFSPADVLVRVAELGDLFAPYQTQRQELPHLS